MRKSILLSFMRIRVDASFLFLSPGPPTNANVGVSLTDPTNFTAVTGSVTADGDGVVIPAAVISRQRPARFHVERTPEYKGPFHDMSYWMNCVQSVRVTVWRGVFQALAVVRYLFARGRSRSREGRDTGRRRRRRRKPSAAGRLHRYS